MRDNFLRFPFVMQRSPTVMQTSHFLPGVIIKIQDSGCLKILTNGSVTLSTPELTFSSAMQESVRV